MQVSCLNLHLINFFCLFGNPNRYFLDVWKVGPGRNAKNHHQLKRNSATNTATMEADAISIQTKKCVRVRPITKATPVQSYAIHK